MQLFARGWIRGSVAALMCLFLAACGSGGDENPGGGDPAPFPSGAGIRQGLLLSNLETNGWIVCFEDTYADQGAPIADIRSACAGPYLMLACAPGTGDALTLAAADARSVLLQADTATGHHVANGVGWYFTETDSWGFFPAGEALTRNKCDLETATSNDKRLCWHAFEGDLDDGFRCGNPATTGTTWRRLVLTHP